MRRAHLLCVLFAAPLFASGEDAPTPTKESPSAEVRVPDDLEPTRARAAELLASLQESLDGAESAGEWPYEGVYRVGGEIPIGYRVGGTAICAWALIEAPSHAASEAQRSSVERGLRFVLDGLEHELMTADFRGGYDVRGWGHTYALTLLLRLRSLGLVPDELRARVDEKVEWLVRTLAETEIPDAGGWNYARRSRDGGPAAASPFMTAPTLLALYEAHEQDETVDRGVVERALDRLEASRTELGTIPYTTAGGRDAMPGAIGRTPVTEVALYLAGRGDTDRIRHALDGFFEHWEWLEKRRRQTGTHVEPYGIAPYYFFYAHYYAALAIEHLPEGERPRYRLQLLERLFQVQEDSGGWNDRVFPRSENYGTAMALLALLQPDLPRPVGWGEAVEDR